MFEFGLVSVRTVQLAKFNSVYACIDASVVIYILINELIIQ